MGECLVSLVPRPSYTAADGLHHRYVHVRLGTRLGVLWWVGRWCMCVICVQAWCVHSQHVANTCDVNGVVILVLSCTFLYFLVLSCTFLYFLVLSCTFLYFLVLSCTSYS